MSGAADSMLRVGSKNQSPAAVQHMDFCFQQCLDLFSFSQVSSVMEKGRSLSPEIDGMLGSSRTMVSGCQKGVLSFASHAWSW